MLRAAELPLPLRIAGAGGRAGHAGAAARSCTPARSPSLHPSLHEGFGLTPLEAMTQGKRPSSRTPAPAVTEVCGDAALYATTAAELTLSLDALQADPAGRTNAYDKAEPRAALFTWRRSALAHIEAYGRAQ